MYAWFGGDAAAHYNKPGSKKQNAWGLHDMHGNLSEWTLDQYVGNRKEHFGKKRVMNPWIRVTKPYPHVCKGGHWQSKLEETASAARGQSKPEWKAIDPQDPKSVWYHTDAKQMGFRVVRPTSVPTVEEMYQYWNSGVEYDNPLNQE